MYRKQILDQVFMQLSLKASIHIIQLHSETHTAVKAKILRSENCAYARKKALHTCHAQTTARYTCMTLFDFTHTERFSVNKEWLNKKSLVT